MERISSCPSTASRTPIAKMRAKSKTPTQSKRRKRRSNLLPLAGSAAAPALAQVNTSNRAETAALVREPLVGHGAMLGVDTHGHAAGGEEHASAAPQLDCAEVVGEFRDEVTGDDGAGEGEDGAAGVHHARPLAELGLGGGVGAEDVCD